MITQGERQDGFNAMKYKDTRYISELSWKELGEGYGRNDVGEKNEGTKNDS